MRARWVSAGVCFDWLWGLAALFWIGESEFSSYSGRVLRCRMSFQ